MNADQHALAILRAIQTAELDGCTVTVDEDHSALLIGDRFAVVEPMAEGDPWDWRTR